MSRPRRTVRDNGTGTVVPEVTVARLPIYLRVLTALDEDGVTTVSSDTLAAEAGMTPAKVRKDLSYLGSYGTRGVGYDVGILLERISTRLGLTEDRAVLLAGVGNLGHALARYGGFPARGFRIVALVDADPDRAGELVGGVQVRPVEELERLIEDCQVTIGVICTPAGAAQEVCDRMVAAGVTSILNFAPAVLNVPGGVDVRKVDLAVELQILSFHEARKRTNRAGRVRPATVGTLAEGGYVPAVRGQGGATDDGAGTGVPDVMGAPATPAGAGRAAGAGRSAVGVADGERSAGTAAGGRERAPGAGGDGTSTDGRTGGGSVRTEARASTVMPGPAGTGSEST